MSKHTPGPWKFRPSDLTIVAPRLVSEPPCENPKCDGNCTQVAMLFNEDGPAFESLMEGDARLIAAAPKLLDACKEALQGLAAHAIGATDSNRVNSDRNVAEVRRIHALLKAAIAEAEGE